MGYNTPILILNDALGELEKYPNQFVTGIVQVMDRGGDVPVGNHCNPVHVMQSQHADVFRLLLVQGNQMDELSEYVVDKMPDDMPEWLIDSHISRMKMAKSLLKDYEKKLKAKKAKSGK